MEKNKRKKSDMKKRSDVQCCVATCKTFYKTPAHMDSDWNAPLLTGRSI